MRRAGGWGAEERTSDGKVRRERWTAVRGIKNGETKRCECHYRGALAAEASESVSLCMCCLPALWCSGCGSPISRETGQKPRDRVPRALQVRPSGCVPQRLRDRGPCSARGEACEPFSAPEHASRGHTRGSNRKVEFYSRAPYSVTLRSLLLHLGSRFSDIDSTGACL